MFVCVVFFKARLSNYGSWACSMMAGVGIRVCFVGMFQGMCRGMFRGYVSGYVSRHHELLYLQYRGDGGHVSVRGCATRVPFLNLSPPKRTNPYLIQLVLISNTGNASDVVYAAAFTVEVGLMKGGGPKNVYRLSELKNICIHMHPPPPAKTYRETMPIQEIPYTHALKTLTDPALLSG